MKCVLSTSMLSISEMVQELEPLGINSDDLWSVPRYYMEEGEMASSTLSSDLHIHVKQTKMHVE